MILVAEGAPAFMIGARGLTAPECGLLHRFARELPLEAPCLLCVMSARSRGELVPNMCKGAVCYSTADMLAKLSRQRRITLVAWCMMQVFSQPSHGRSRVSHQGRKLGMRRSVRALVQRHVGEGTEKRLSEQ